jgi:hypothetical protein
VHRVDQHPAAAAAAAAHSLLFQGSQRSQLGPLQWSMARKQQADLQQQQQQVIAALSIDHGTTLQRTNTDCTSP